ncbi:MAG: winged helix-turn-helix transcriptional regulator [Candidatus Hadarchaeum sp.]|uniref:winged helix-turn-helix transcriptional regulator n=1 Tax=Candidatus Hadarchaeum sp. TaxID=2883567 RepID=UPI003D0A3CCD
MDELDLKILQMLENDGSLSFTEIARRLRLNESTVRKRVLALKEKGVIKKFTIVVDHEKIGFSTLAVVGIDATPDKLLEIAQKLAELPETKYVATSTGDHMIMTEIWARDGRELSRILSEKIGAIEGVKKICPAIILEKIK